VTGENVGVITRVTHLIPIWKVPGSNSYEASPFLDGHFCGFTELLPVDCLASILTHCP
jgi:hypothetical protein